VAESIINGQAPAHFLLLIERLSIGMAVIFILETSFIRQQSHIALERAMSDLDR